MKLVALGDTHGTPYWKDIVSVEKPDVVVFIGDYFDGYSNKFDEVGNFQDIIQYKEESSASVILLIGNHDHHYFPEVGCTGTSRYQQKIARKLEGLIQKNRPHLQMAYQYENVLFTHAGVTKTFMNNTFGEDWSENNIPELLNKKFEDNANAFCFNGVEPTGDDITQTPIWVRPASLIIDKVPLTQVVGHTMVGEIGFYKNVYLIDTMQTSKQYLVFDEGTITKKIIDYAR